ncbi:MAG: PilZ domain-containing protein [Lachnospiraceae bacterium]|nr:PilZ domain-containing protein [Lachnospiraceae bacterium]
MIEKRRDKRFNVKLELVISSLFRQDNICIENIDAPITVVDISKGGIGFHSRSILPVGYYFNACIQLSPDDSSKLYSVVKIIRCIDLDHGMKGYGCEFVGLAPVLSYIFEEFIESQEQDGGGL